MIATLATRGSAQDNQAGDGSAADDRAVGSLPGHDPGPLSPATTPAGAIAVEVRAVAASGVIDGSGRRGDRADLLAFVITSGAPACEVLASLSPR